MAYKAPLHGRDHCPGGADPIPCLGSYPFQLYRGRANRTGSLQTIPTGMSAWTYVTFTSWQVTPGQNYISSLTTGNTGLVLHEPGVYLIAAYLRFSATFSAERRIRPELSGVSETDISVLQSETITAEADSLITWPLYLDAAPAELWLGVMQNSGSNKSVLLGALRAYLLGLT